MSMVSLRRSLDHWLQVWLRRTEPKDLSKYRTGTRYRERVLSFLISSVHHFGGSILGTSRGPQDVTVMVDFLLEEKIDIYSSQLAAMAHKKEL